MPTESYRILLQPICIELKNLMACIIFAIFLIPSLTWRKCTPPWPCSGVAQKRQIFHNWIMSSKNLQTCEIVVDGQTNTKELKKFWIWDWFCLNCWGPGTIPQWTRNLFMLSKCESQWPSSNAEISAIRLINLCFQILILIKITYYFVDDIT